MRTVPVARGPWPPRRRRVWSAGVHPVSPRSVDDTYIASVRRIIRMCEASDIYVVVEPHQDEMHARFCGEGAPDWWAQKHTRVKNFPVPVQPTPFAASPPTHKTCNGHSSFSYIWTDDAARAYQVG